MKTVILDGYALNPGDLSWDLIRKLGECIVYDRTPATQTVERAKDADAVFTNKVILDDAVMQQLPKLKYIGVLATGYNVVDIDAAKRRGIVVTNVPAYSTESVAQMVFAHLLNLTCRVQEHSAEVIKGKWTRSLDFSYWDFPQIELQGSTMGIVGYGNIGQAVTRIALAFGMKVLVYSRRKPEALPAGCIYAGLETVYRESDVISLHCPLTKDTEKMINEASLSVMKQTAFLINTGRGLLIDEQALAYALNTGRIAGAGLDVLSTEPPKADNPLLHAKNCFITPHIAWATRAARLRLLKIASANLEAFMKGESLNVVG